MFTKSVEAYFNGEKQASLFWMILGLVSIVAAVVFFLALKKPFWKGMSIVFIIIGLVQLMAGIWVHSGIDKRRIEVVYNMGMNPGTIKQKEIPEITTLMKNIVYYRYAEIFFVVMGLLTFLLFTYHEDRQFWAGIGLALAIQACIVLAADGMAEKRGHHYQKVLQEYLTSLKSPAN